MMNTKRIYVKDLNANDRFCLPGHSDIYVCDFRRTEGHMTRVDYHMSIDHSVNSYSFAKVNLSSVDVVV